VLESIRSKISTGIVHAKLMDRHSKDGLLPFMAHLLLAGKTVKYSLLIFY
jgi:hypothetical protein